ncbi:hypothetical protein DVH05_014797 [Phytophthora capsici]|nr:hypothetical protein DVH05_014797 [Phytophthora capsici]
MLHVVAVSLPHRPVLPFFGLSTRETLHNASIENVSADAEVFVDGAKRDRTPWPGDYGVATLSKVVSLNGDNLLSVRNALESIIAIQAPSGEFPYAGTPLGLGYQEAGTNSDTYHLWTIIALADYTMLSNDKSLLKEVWGQVQLGFEFSLDKVDTSDSLLNVTDLSDWGRVGQGGKNTAANSLLYHALVSYAQLANDLGLSELMYQGKSYCDIARDVKTAVNDKLWDESAGFFRDNTTTAFHPQDGNVLAVHFNPSNMDYDKENDLQSNEQPVELAQMLFAEQRVSLHGLRRRLDD